MPPDEGRDAFLHRFAMAAAGRDRVVPSGTVEDIVALDVALRRKDRDRVEVLARKIARKLYYGHAFGHVFHQPCRA